MQKSVGFTRLSAIFLMAVLNLFVAPVNYSGVQATVQVRQDSDSLPTSSSSENGVAPVFNGPKAVVTTNLKIAEGFGPFRPGQKLNATFTITNRGDADLVMKRLYIVAAHFDECPCFEFTPVANSITLKPGGTFDYSGSFIIPQSNGFYRLQIRYQKPRGLPAKPDADIGVVDDVIIAAGNRLPPAKRGTALISMNEDDGKKIPLILIHGIHGADTARVISEQTDYWNFFHAKFTANPGLKKTYARYVFQYYSDQEEVPQLATHLGNAIDAKLADRPHVLLAHSMGGLVAKSYMVSYRHRSGQWAGTSGGTTTNLLITLATPHHGSPGANDPDSIDQYMGEDWKERLAWKAVFHGVNFLYWADSAGFGSPPTRNSGNANRSDLRWDNFDGAMRPNEDVNSWLSAANGPFRAYASKAILYAGSLRPVASDLKPFGALRRLARARGPNQRLQFANEAMLFGLSRRFGISDGMVPYRSALLCDDEVSLVAPGSSFICPSPTRVRRFEPGEPTELSVDDKTLSITRREGGYDHLHMLQDPQVLNWVVKDLDLAQKVVVSVSLQLSPDKGPYSIGRSITGTFSITNRGRAVLDTKQVWIAGGLGGKCIGTVCPDFTIRPDVKLAPNQKYDYTGTFTPSSPGTYTFSVAYQTPDGTRVIPVDSEKGTINQLKVVVPVPPPTLTSSSPSSVRVGTEPQLVHLHGTGLSQILYCRLTAPDGKFTFIYIPLFQVRGRSDVLLETRIKFPMRGKYIITAFTMDKGKSNDLEITAN